MAAVETLGEIDEVGIGLVGCALDISVGPFARTEHRQSPTVLHQACRSLHADIVETVVAHTIPDATALLGIDSAGSNIDCATYRGS